jgi:hypothetical protein
VEARAWGSLGRVKWGLGNRRNLPVGPVQRLSAPAHCQAAVSVCLETRTSLSPGRCQCWLGAVAQCRGTKSPASVHDAAGC